MSSLSIIKMRQTMSAREDHGCNPASAEVTAVIREYKVRFGTPAAIKLSEAFKNTVELLAEMKRQLAGDNTALQARAAEVEKRIAACYNSLTGEQVVDGGTLAGYYADLAEISNTLARDGAAIGDPRSALEMAQDLDDAETMATRAGDYPL